MIIITEEILKNSEKLSKLIENEKNYLNTYTNSQQEFKSILIDYMQKFADSTEHIDTNCVDTVLNFLEDLKRCLNLVNENLSILNEKSKNLDILFENLYSTQKNASLYNAFLTYTDFNNSSYEKDEIILKNTIQIEELLHSIFQYSNLQFCNDIKNIPEIENSNLKTEEVIEKDNLSDTQNTTNTTNNIPDTDDSTSTNNTNSNNPNPTVEKVEFSKNIETIENIKDIEKNEEQNTVIRETSKYITLNENTLFISETKGKVILPYSISNLEELLKSNPDKYTNIEDIIEDKYTIPISLYKSASLARFREAFKLVRNREKSSIKEAFDLGMELLFNYNLHPAIISACKNLNELDIYLDYLENNETDKFDLFKIEFEIAPVVHKEQRFFD